MRSAGCEGRKLQVLGQAPPAVRSCPSMRPLPWYYTVNDRPVMIVELPDGGSDCLVLDLDSGSFVPDRSYLARTAPGSGGDVDVLAQAAMESCVARWRAEILRRWASRVASVDPRDAAGLLATLSISGDPPPFDGSACTLATGPSMRIETPRLLWRERLDASLGAPTTHSVGAGRLQSAYVVTIDGAPAACSIVAEYAASDCDRASAAWIRLMAVARP